MSKETYAILYSSKTGNTKMLAQAIREALPEQQCRFFGESNAAPGDAQTLYIGFWTDKGTADEATLALLDSLENKNIFLFGTAGFGESEAYFQKVLERVKTHIAPSNTLIGEYMCQGKMPLSVRQRYASMKQQPNPAPNLDALIANFDRALQHPDSQDLAALRQLVSQSR